MCVFLTFFLLVTTHVIYVLLLMTVCHSPLCSDFLLVVNGLLSTHDAQIMLNASLRVIVTEYLFPMPVHPCLCCDFVNARVIDILMHDSYLCHVVCLSVCYGAVVDGYHVCNMSFGTFVSHAIHPA